MKRFVVLFICILLQHVLVPAQTGTVKGELGEKLDNLMTDFSKEVFWGAVLVVQNGEIILDKGYGLAD